MSYRISVSLSQEVIDAHEVLGVTHEGPIKADSCLCPSRWSNLEPSSSPGPRAPLALGCVV